MSDSAFRTRLKEVVGDNTSEFARKIGIPQPTLHSYIAGKYDPGYDFFQRLAENDVDVNWLLTGKRSAVLSDDPWMRRHGKDLGKLISKLNKKERSAFSAVLIKLNQSISE
ncbi:MAG: helix-turn-helix transcriptional regulator [Acidobacteria bacterium]|nr:helix-turn-helix transcriptional regulator [Acidobacteriota bacterium]